MSDSRRPPFPDVLATARRGSPEALGSLYRQFQPGLLRLLSVIAPHQADDLAADVWMEVAGTLHRFSGDERAFGAWLATTARRRVIDAVRRSGRRPDSLDAEAAGELAAFATRVVSVLPRDQADVVVLRVVGGLDVAQVAHMLHRHPATVRSLQQRALRRLARQIDPEPLSA